MIRNATAKEPATGPRHARRLSRPRSAFPHLVLAGLVAFLPLNLPGQTSEFGRSEHQGNALIGILYDLKQNQKRQPCPMNISKFYKNIETFINRGYDESVLDDFFRSARALYTTQIFISDRPAKFGPEAFGVEKYVKPTYWLAHYKGQVIPPRPGTYEFVSAADGFVGIAVNGKNILIKHDSNKNQYLKQLGGAMGGKAAKGVLRRSLPFESDGKTPIDLDILLAEAGGEFNAFVLYRREGETYPRDEAGREILPVFQLEPHLIPEAPSDKAPRFSPSREYWRAVP